MLVETGWEQVEQAASSLAKKGGKALGYNHGPIVLCGRGGWKAVSPGHSSRPYPPVALPEQQTIRKQVRLGWVGL